MKLIIVALLIQLSEHLTWGTNQFRWISHGGGFDKLKPFFAKKHLSLGLCSANMNENVELARHALASLQGPTSYFNLYGSVFF